MGYVGQGWNPGNVNGMLEFFNRGEVPGSKQGGNGNGNGHVNGNGKPAATTMNDDELAAYKILLNGR